MTTQKLSATIMANPKFKYLEVITICDVRDCVASEIKNRGFKQAAIADKAGLTNQQLSDIVNKRRRLDANEMVSLCRAMGITPNDLLVAVRDSA